MHVYFTNAKKQFAPFYGDTAIKEQEFFTSVYGTVGTPMLKIVELPDDTVPTAWAPEISAIARAISMKRLTIAFWLIQWHTSGGAGW